MNFIFFVFLRFCFSDGQQLPTQSGFNSIKLKPKETIQFNNINPQSFFLFTNPDPRIFKLVVRSNADYMSEPFADNGPVLDIIKFGQKSESSADQKESTKNARLLVDNLNNNSRKPIDNINDNSINKNVGYNNEKVNKVTNNNNVHDTNSNNNENKGNYNNIQNNMPNNNNENNNNRQADAQNNFNNNRINDRNNFNNNRINDQNNFNNNQNNRINDQNNFNNNQNNRINDQNNFNNNQFNNQNHQINNQRNSENRFNNIDNDILKKSHKITEKDLVFGIFVGSKGYHIIITALESSSNDQTISIDFYYLVQKDKAFQIYLSTYPNDIFGVGRSPEGFDVCKPFKDKLISYWNVPGETVYYETNSLNQSKSGKINVMSDNQNLLTYSTKKSISKTRVSGNFLYFDWITDESNRNSFYKVLVRSEANANNYIEKYKSEGIERYSTALKNNIVSILPPTRYQFIRPMHVSYISAKHRYGQFSRKKDTIPLTSLDDGSSWAFSKTAIIVIVVMFIIILIIISVIDKIQSISYSTGFGEGSRRKVKHRKRREHKNIKDPQSNNNFGLEYYVEGDGREKELSEEEDDGIDDGNLSITKKKKRSPEMNGIMEKILENKK